MPDIRIMDHGSLFPRSVRVYLVPVDGGTDRQFPVRVKVILVPRSSGQPAGFNCVIRLNVLPLAFPFCTQPFAPPAVFSANRRRMADASARVVLPCGSNRLPDSPVIMPGCGQGLARCCPVIHHHKRYLLAGNGSDRRRKRYYPPPSGLPYPHS